MMLIFGDVRIKGRGSTQRLVKFSAAASRRLDCYSCPMSKSTISTPSPLEITVIRGTRHNPDFIERFLGFLPVDTLLVLGKVNRLLHYIVQDYSEAQWNISDTLRLWFPSVSATRAVLDNCGAIIGGSAALGFFSRSDDMRQMDIFIQFGGLLRLGTHIIASGYVAQGRSTSRYSFSRSAFTAPLLSRASAFASVPIRQDPPIAEYSFIHAAKRAHRPRITIFVVRPEPIQFILSLPHS